MNDLLVILDIGGRSAAIAAVDVQSVIELEDIYPVPMAPDFVVGLAAMRSQSLTVIDARKAIGLPDAGAAGERAVVVEVGGHQYALLVDAVHDVTGAQSEIKPVPGGFGALWECVAEGMVETGTGPTLLIKKEALVAGPEALAA